MKKQKFNSITFHEAAAKIVDQYFGEIPFYHLITSADVETKKGKTVQSFMIWYKDYSYRSENPDFFSCTENPVKALAFFENALKFFWGIPIPEEKPEPIVFELPIKN